VTLTACWFAISLPRVAGIVRPQLRALAFPSDHRLSLANNIDRKVTGRRSDKTSITRSATVVVYRIIEAIHSTVSEELWPEVLRKIDGPVAADSPADEFEDCDDAEDEYDPADFDEAEELRSASR
jgi:hypothetical protein